MKGERIMARKVKALVMLLSLFVSLVNVYAQQTESPEETKITQYRTETNELTSRLPPSEAREAHAAALGSLRRKLRDLLIEKRDRLTKDIQALKATTSSPEFGDYIARLEVVISSINAEVEALDEALKQNLVAAASTIVQAPPQASPTPQPSAAPPGPDVELNRSAFETSVANFSDDQLKAAAAPAELAGTKSSKPACNEDGRPISTTFSRLDEFICRTARDIAANRQNRRLLISQDQALLFAIIISRVLKTEGSESYVAFVSEAQEARTDQQMGAGPNSAGTTSLVVKGSVPYVLGLAVENGAAMQSRSDTTVTFRVNPMGLINTFANKGFITGFRQAEQDPVQNFLRKASLGFTFDTSRGTQPGVLVGDRQQLSALSVRYEFVNHRDPRLRRYEKDWEEFVANEGVRLGQQVFATTLAVNNFGTRNSPMSFKDPALQAWLEQTNKLIAAASADQNEIERILRSQVEAFPVKLVSQETINAVTEYARQFQAYTEAKNRLLDRIAKARVFTVEYTNDRAVNAPDTSNFNFIAATGTGPRIDLTANGSFTFFNKLRAASLTAHRPKRIRDFQFAGQIDVPFDLGNAGQFGFWFSGRYERLMQDATTAAGTIMPNTKGDIAVGQFGLNIPIKGLGMKFPISLTFANRTELIKEKEIRGNVGFTFNWDNILSRLRP
jgi:hypothetical protein